MYVKGEGRTCVVEAAAERFVAGAVAARSVVMAAIRIVCTVIDVRSTNWKRFG